MTTPRCNAEQHRNNLLGKLEEFVKCRIPIRRSRSDSAGSVHVAPGVQPEQKHKLNGRFRLTKSSVKMPAEREAISDIRRIIGDDDPNQRKYSFKRGYPK